MKIIKKETAQEKVRKLTVEELLDGIAGAIQKLNGKISADRRASIESHLRICFRTLGYKPRETLGADGKPVTTAAELAAQLAACLQATGEVSEETHAHLHTHLIATHSNCLADLTFKSAPELKLAPAPAAGEPKPEPPAEKKNPPASAPASTTETIENKPVKK